MDKIKLGISACLTGEKVRYDGQHKLDHYLMDILGKFVEYVPVCPEVGCGMTVPREAMRLVGDKDSPRLMTIRTQVDKTDIMVAWAKPELDRLAQEDLCGFVFKSKSPSSGMSFVKIYNSGAGIPVKNGVGIFARMFMERFPLLPVEDEGRLHDDRLRENFIERVFAYARWRDYERNDNTVKGLMDFHSRHKLLLMAHQSAAVARLGRLGAGATRATLEDCKKQYLPEFLKAMSCQATARKHVNVLQHILGYFKKDLTADEKAEMLELISRFHAGRLPLIVPVTMLAHFVRKYHQPYLMGQYYLEPGPEELALRNHV